MSCRALPGVAATLGCIGKVEIQQPKVLAQHARKGSTRVQRMSCRALPGVAATLGCIGKVEIQQPKVRAQHARKDSIPISITSWHVNFAGIAPLALTGRVQA